MRQPIPLCGALCGAMLVPALVAHPAALAKPTGTLAAANSQTLPLESAKELLQRDRGRAEDLVPPPPLWNWSKPVTAQQVSQAAPAAQPAAQPAPTTAAEPGEEGDILDEVSVTATRRPTRQRDTTATTYAVKKEDFKAQGAVTATDALQLIPGFVGQPSLGGVRNAGGNFLRGFDDQRFQVLRDGFNITYPQNGRSALSQISVDDLERIEVVTGGATLRYGAGSVGGVINLITETPKGPPKFLLEYQAGSYGFTRYLGKYGGGDDTFSYNLVFSSVVAFNNYPFKITVPNTTQFYGPSSNANSKPPQNAIDAGTLPGTTTPGVYPNAQFDPNTGAFLSGNSNNIAGPGNNDPDNTGPIDLYGYLKPTVGPPVTVQGIQDSAYNAADSYTGKFTWKPDPINKITLRANARNNRFDDQGPGANYFNLCIAGATAAPDGNGTTAGDRFFPLDRNGRETSCPGLLAIGTATTQFQFGLPFAFNTSYNGKTVFPTGNPYPAAEGALANILFFTRRSTSNVEVTLNWDADLTPTTSLNSYVAFNRQVFQTSRPTPYFYNTNLLGGLAVNGPTASGIGEIAFAGTTQPYSDGNKFEAQTAINTQLSPGQTLSFGVNFIEDRVYQQQGRGRSFFDRAIARTSLFLVDDISFSDLVKANVGLRYTSSSQFGEVVTPGAGLRVTPFPWLSFRGNWSQVFNAPNIADLYVISGIFIDNPNLRPETGITYDFGADFTPAPNLGFKVTYFNTYLNNTFTAITFVNPDVNNPDSPTFQSGIVQQIQNIAGRRASGIEVEGNWQINDQLRLRVAYTNTDARNFGLNDSIVNGSFFYQYQDPSIPFNNLVATLTYLNKGLLVSLVGRYDSGKRRPGTDTFVGAWGTLDLAVELPVTPNFTILGNVFNITDTQYEFFPGNPAPGTTFRVGARVELGG
ncbi:TonB-dependent receptor [Gloeobacter kilaueensis]|uniref:TonB-dependent receptor n=1 Tax=Gloeobacter kilaueensis (strain ATCC BAA-2537 / CCAP 1431/1 / ULC 316 / JS1) TaxID=1183438 RepID=U5QJF0_GLOK1|nr:TonB-dependent receptor [Gloeobacter kilaueensis]AGY59041.1 TonB-dependent receptor [Gloeobacter kilaueensis JS1]